MQVFIIEGKILDMWIQMKHKSLIKLEYSAFSKLVFEQSAYLNEYIPGLGQGLENVSLAGHKWKTYLM